MNSSEGERPAQDCMASAVGSGVRSRLELGGHCGVGVRGVKERSRRVACRESGPV